MTVRRNLSVCSALTFALLALTITSRSALAESTFTVEPVTIVDEKAVFATVESRNVVAARVRTGGTIASLSVREGDRVARGQVIAAIGDQKLVLEKTSLDAQIAALQAQFAQAQSNLARAKSLFANGVTSRERLDELATAASVARNTLSARGAERAVLEQQLTEGEVLAPTAGRVLKVPVTLGAVVLSGETVAAIAEEDFVLRLRIPERHAHLLKAGDAIRLDGEDLGQGAANSGVIALIYPQIQDGMVVADAKVPGLSDYFVGERIRVWISGGARRTFVVPANYILTRFGIDYARVRIKDGSVIDVPVQRGGGRASPDMPDGLEILSGLQAGDALVRP